MIPFIKVEPEEIRTQRPAKTETDAFPTDILKKKTQLPDSTIGSNSITKLITQIGSSDLPNSHSQKIITDNS
jgi:hypothetical protein